MLLLGACMIAFGFLIFVFEYQLWVWAHQWCGVPKPTQEYFEMPETPLQCAIRLGSLTFSISGTILATGGIVDELQWVCVVLATTIGTALFVITVVALVLFVRRLRRGKYPL